MTNREALHLGLIPCEANPITGDLSYYKDQFHAVAVVTVATMKSSDTHETLVHLCFECATKHFMSWDVYPGIRWTTNQE